MSVLFTCVCVCKTLTQRFKHRHVNKEPKEVGSGRVIEGGLGGVIVSAGRTMRIGLGDFGEDFVVEGKSQ